MNYGCDFWHMEWYGIKYRKSMHSATHNKNPEKFLAFWLKSIWPGPRKDWDDLKCKKIIGSPHFYKKETVKAAQSTKTTHWPFSEMGKGDGEKRDPQKAGSRAMGKIDLETIPREQNRGQKQGIVPISRVGRPGNICPGGFRIAMDQCLIFFPSSNGNIFSDYSFPGLPLIFSVCVQFTSFISSKVSVSYCSR